MTHGEGCHFQRWSDNLEKLLQSRWPGAKVINLSQPGTKSTHVWTNLDELEEHKPDIILVDYAINDAYAKEEDFYAREAIHAGSNEFRQLQDMTRKVVVSILNLPWKPALVYLETFTHYVLFGYNCSHRVNEFPHWAALEEFQIPVVSYTEAACTSPDMPAFQAAWEDECHRPSGPHAQCWVHRALSHLMADFIEVSADEANTQGALLGKEHPAADMTTMVGSACALRPLTKYVAKPFGSVKLFPSTSNEGWNYTEDSSGKPGWIAAEGAPHDIVFAMNTSGSDHSAVLMEYLFTYEHVGSIQCWLDADDKHNWTVNALVQAHVSLSDVLVMELPTSTSHGTHEFHCRTDGRKFKILSLRSC